MQKVEEREAVTLINREEKIFGIIHRPLNAVKCPAVVFCPGFAGNKSGKFRLSVKLAQELAKQGIVALRFDYRGCGDSEGEFRELTLEGKVSDTLTCLRFLAQDAQVDSSRLGIFGRSLGGLIAILSAEQFHQIKSLVLWSPVFTSHPWKKMWEEFKILQKHRSDHDQPPLPLPANVPNLHFLQEFFNLRLQDALHTLKDMPLLHIQGEQDMVTTMEHMKAYQIAREGLSHTRFVSLPHSGHDFENVEEQQLAIQETCQWFKQTL